MCSPALRFLPVAPFFAFLRTWKIKFRLAFYGENFFYCVSEGLICQLKSLRDKATFLTNRVYVNNSSVTFSSLRHFLLQGSNLKVFSYSMSQRQEIAILDFTSIFRLFVLFLLLFDLFSHAVAIIWLMIWRVLEVLFINPDLRRSSMLFSCNTRQMQATMSLWNLTQSHERSHLIKGRKFHVYSSSFPFLFCKHTNTTFTVIWSLFCNVSQTLFNVACQYQNELSIIAYENKVIQTEPLYSQIEINAVNIVLSVKRLSAGISTRHEKHKEQREQWN